MTKMMVRLRSASSACFSSDAIFHKGSLGFLRHGTTALTTTSSSCRVITLLRLHSLCQSSTCPNPNHIPNHHTELQQLLNEKCKLGFDKLDDALVVFDKMLRMKPLPTVIHFTQLLAALVKMKHYSAAVSVFSDMCSFSISVNIITYSIVINCCCHLKRVDYGFALLAAIFKRGFVPDVVTYTTLVRGLISQDKFLEAELMFSYLLQHNQIQPDAAIFTTIIDGLCKIGNTSRAMRLLRYMEKKGCMPSLVTYTTIIDSLSKDRLVDDALGLLIYQNISAGFHTKQEIKVNNNLISILQASNLISMKIGYG
nr:PREDICTED: putative pentatricopeptide repeat-containing protein At1g12700, mitochondrial [Daucus carota subsp. sativus]